MVEVHGWITLRETYQLIEEENDEAVIRNVKEEIRKRKGSGVEIKVVNGEYFIEILLFTNHMSSDVKEVISFFQAVGKLAEGSYGLLYVHNDEDPENYNKFIVYRLARGKTEIYQDNLLSPFVPTVEDADSI